MVPSSTDAHFPQGIFTELRALMREFASKEMAEGAMPAERLNERAALAQLVSAVEKSPAPELVSGLEGDGLPITSPTLVLRVEVVGAEAFAGELSDMRTTNEINKLRLHVRAGGRATRPHLPQQKVCCSYSMLSFCLLLLP